MRVWWPGSTNWRRRWYAGGSGNPSNKRMLTPIPCRRQAQNESRINPFLSPQEHDKIAQGAVGAFLTKWIRLEKIVLEKASKVRPSIPPNAHPGQAPWSRAFEFLAPDSMARFREVQYMRNMLVHGQREFTPDELQLGTNTIDQLIDRLQSPGEEPAS